MKPAALLLGLALAGATLVAPAARADDEAAATQLFNAGRDLMKQGDFAAACPKLAESARLKPTVGALAKLAACEEHEKRLVSAYTRWQQALNVARSVGDERAADVEREVARIARVVPKVSVATVGVMPADAVIRIDDTTLGPASLGVPLPVEPGPHTVQATAAGKKAWSTTVQSSADGATTTVSIPPFEDAPALAPVPLPSPSPAPATSPTTSTPPSPSTQASPSPSSSPWPTVGLVTAATGLVSLAAGGAFGFVAMGKRNDAHCQGTTCPDAPSASTLGDAKTAADWSTGLLIAGGVLAASGVTLWFVSRDAHDAPVRVGATPLPGGLSIAGSWR